MTALMLGLVCGLVYAKHQKDGLCIQGTAITVQHSGMPEQLRPTANDGGMHVEMDALFLWLCSVRAAWMTELCWPFEAFVHHEGILPV